ncbi:ABC transporter substrate-binding protein [Enterovibrio calviensis]|uniref:ABC transporter substrate-binding protein n=1 Tax=Enterovibrio calviensis TaxID=91359 RepID=UPI000AB6EA89|nr:ABC transporter substrate-binding protein [Enterovibrio calviensis]
MATSHRKVDDTTYEFSLRKGVKFQDGTPFNADAVLLNMKHFKEAPFLFTKIDTVFDRAEKVDNYTVRFHLKEKYGQFLNDAIWIQFYTETYLDKFGWNGKATCPNLAEPGPYGLGPYILKEGYIEGDRQTPKAVLVANPNYWNPEYPKIETVTVYTELDSKKALEMTLDNDNSLDIMPIPFSEKERVLQSRYAKLVSAPSTNNIAIHINMRTGNKRLLDKEVRVALNKALDQRRLLEKSYQGEGQISPTLAAPLYPGVDKVVKNLKAYSEVQSPKAIRDELKKTLDGLELNVYTQDRFMYIWKGIDRDLRKVGVKLKFNITNSEKDVFGQLLSTNAKKNTEDWDLLVWGDDDWYYNHPWSAFFVYRTHNAWSTIFQDNTMDDYIEQMFKESVGTAEFDDIAEKIMRRAYDNGYMLFVPTPNKVLAVNKQVNYSPFRMANIPLWEISVKPEHWSAK